MFVCLCRIVAVVITAFVISGCTNQKEEYKKAIHSVLDQDAQTGKVDRSSIDSFVYSSKTKALNMKKIDLSKCPPEFQAAYIAYSIAWAKKYNVRLILNMHVPQGGYQSQGDGLALWQNLNNQNRLIALWTEIARRYANEDAIIGYNARWRNKCYV